MHHNYQQLKSSFMDSNRGSSYNYDHNLSTKVDVVF